MLPGEGVHDGKRRRSRIANVLTLEQIAAADGQLYGLAAAGAVWRRLGKEGWAPIPMTVTSEPAGTMPNIPLRLG